MAALLESGEGQDRLTFTEVVAFTAGAVFSEAFSELSTSGDEDGAASAAGGGFVSEASIRAFLS